VSIAYSGFDHACMARALQLAEQGLWTTRPNPRVGCVIAQGERIVGEGAHLVAGEPHAEVHALRHAGTAARGGTAYVTLEPCAHTGRTPPCADALLAAGIARVVVATRDPFPKVDGRGTARLRACGVRVDVGLMEDAARELNVGFFSRIERGRPWLRLKLAASLDGRTALAHGESKWITSSAARADVQRWRARACAILSSSATIRADDPMLTVRIAHSLPIPAPLRVIVCGPGGMPTDAKLLHDRAAEVLLVHADGQPMRPFPDRVETLALPPARFGVELSALLHALAERGINEVHSECGPRLAGALLAQGLADELLLYQAPLLLGERGRPLLAGIDPATMEQRVGMRVIDRRMIGEDARLLLRPIRFT